MHLPFQSNTHGIALTLLGLTLASGHVARAFPMPTSELEGSLKPRLENSESWAIALGPRDGLTSEVYSPSASNLQKGHLDSESDLVRRDDAQDTEADDQPTLLRRMIPAKQGSSTPNRSALKGATQPSDSSKDDTRQFVRFSTSTSGGGGVPGGPAVARVDAVPRVASSPGYNMAPQPGLPPSHRGAPQPPAPYQGAIPVQPQAAYQRGAIPTQPQAPPQRRPVAVQHQHAPQSRPIPVQPQAVPPSSQQGSVPGTQPKPYIRAPSGPRPGVPSKPKSPYGRYGWPPSV
ncbi:hypothetical protein K474DRAFT_606598 [Panus rudis PR-1116 ss-1]|nr:hypothetical protein K474DRAFT_606598 [Panus rudis PR-1116 ss-1]